MKSKLTIDLDFDNQPVIRIDYVPSEDVRDKMVKRFLESFGSSSVWARLEYRINPTLQEGSLSTLRPVFPEELEKNGKEISNLSLMLRDGYITTNENTGTININI